MREEVVGEAQRHPALQDGGEGLRQHAGAGNQLVHI